MNALIKDKVSVKPAFPGRKSVSDIEAKALELLNGMKINDSYCYEKRLLLTDDYLSHKCFPYELSHGDWMKCAPMLVVMFLTHVTYGQMCLTIQSLDISLVLDVL